MTTQAISGMNSDTMNNRPVCTLICLLTFGYFLAAFYPFEWALPARLANNAEWLQNGVLSFASPGMAFGGQALSSVTLGDTVTVGLTIFSASPEQWGPARILSFSKNPSLRNLSVAQDGPHLVVRVRRHGADLNGVPALVIPDIFVTPGWHDIEIHVLLRTIEVRAGKHLLKTQQRSKSTELWNWSYPWMLGNERTGDRPWLGWVRKATVCIDNNCTDVLRPEELKLPETYWFGDWENLVDPTQLVKSRAQDVVINLLGFVPLGILLARLRQPAITMPTVVFTAVLLSISLELGQILFHYRYTSLIDVVCNSSGAAIGYWISRSLYGWRMSQQA